MLLQQAHFAMDVLVRARCSIFFLLLLKASQQTIYILHYICPSGRSTEADALLYNIRTISTHSSAPLPVGYIAVGVIAAVAVGCSRRGVVVVAILVEVLRVLAALFCRVVVAAGAATALLG